jgi:hypothetical protein
MCWFYVVEHEGLPYVGFGFGLFEFRDFGDDLVALVVAVRVGGVAIRANLEKSLTRRRWHAKSDLLMEAITFFAGDFRRWRWRLWWLLFRQSLMDFVGVLLEIFTIFWVLQRERQRESED